MPHAARFAAGDAHGQILLKRVSDPSSLGVAVLDHAGRVAHLVEKPKDFISDLAVIGVYFFGPEIHDITPGLQPSARGELEFTDAIQGLINARYHVDSSVIEDEWIDTGKKDDMLEANRVVLDTIRRRVDGAIDGSSRIIGHVVIEQGARIVGSTVRGPAVIGAGAVIEHCYVGPFTAIGENCILEACEIENSIVLEQSSIRNISVRISDSLIGKEVEVVRADGRPRVIQLLLGDHSHVGLV